MPHPLLIVSLAALIGAIVAGAGAWKVRDVNRWPSAQVTVTDTGVRLAEAQRHQRERDEQAKRYLARVAVEGQLEGRLVTSDNSGFDGVPSFERREDAEAYLAAYPVGSQITVRYSPRDPTIIHLGTASLPWGRLGLAGFLLMASLGAFALYTTKT
ncbi:MULTISPECIES: DUF3592 domain-containing protein [Halomonas]|uniref:DUF3592 domain-containing protein n=1 Tax=Halomonas TaxID=2745 RepID=UPI001A908340|nr:MULTISPECIES: DUF3592 domain-containing protein [Halomonas]MBN8411020.1 DUF3592 domain-containing protein [Halomonas litopenaei]MBY5969570.1 DUF3592 domain-containing protein [Halomonas denitrificans]